MMTIKLASLKRNIAAETDGEWIDIPGSEPLRLRTRGTNYGPYQAAKGILEQKWVRQYKGAPVPPKVMFEGNGDLYARHILLEWDGLDVAYDADTAREVLVNPEFRDMHDHVRYAMGMVGIAQIEFLDGDGTPGGNSGGPSASTSIAAGPKTGSSD